MNRDNFYLASKATFQTIKELPISLKDRDPDFTSYQTTIVWEGEDGELKDPYFIKEYADDGDISFISSEDEVSGIKQNHPIIKILSGRYGDIGYLISGPVSSQYWYTKDGVYRNSDHWGYVNQCVWDITEMSGDSFILGFCRWEEFKHIEK